VCGRCTDVGSTVKKYPTPRQYAAPRRDYPSDRVGSDASASYRRPSQSKLRIQRPRARGYDSGSQKEEVIFILCCDVAKLLYIILNFLKVLVLFRLLIPHCLKPACRVADWSTCLAMSGTLAHINNLFTRWLKNFISII